MFHIPVNGAESILEPYYDGGDSYNGHQKATVLPKYRIEPPGCTSQIWCGFSVQVRAGERAVLERSCRVTMTGYDHIRLFWNASPDIKVKLICNGECVIEACGAGHYDILQCRFEQGELTHIRYEFTNSAALEESVLLFYLGAASSEKQREREQPGACIPDWEGCFAEESSDIRPCLEIYLSAEEAEGLRAKMRDPAFRKDYEQTKAFADALADSVPERQIQRVLGNGFRTPIPMICEASALAFVGFIEKDEAKLKLACRYALSIASCEYWCSDQMEAAPTVTWYHRSFNERSICMALSYVMEFAGNFLSWHGRNLIEQAVIMKGVARFEADFMTMEYIRQMNQGIAFEVGYIAALLTLCKRFPRYRARLEEAERDLHEMLDACLRSDGGMLEGAGYWQYTMLGYLYSAYLLARYHSKDVKTYLDGRLSATARFGLAMLASDGTMRTVGDVTGHKRYLNVIPNVMADLTGLSGWVQAMRQSVDEMDGGKIHAFDENRILEYVMGKTLTQLQNCTVDVDEGVQLFPETGYTLWQENGMTFFGVSGPSYSHCHGDKGHFTIEKDGKAIVIDRGVCSYDRSGGTLMGASEMHNLAVPQDGERLLNQRVGQNYAAKLLRAERARGGFVWQTETTDVWDGELVLCHCRTVNADGKGTFLITDEFRFARPLRISFRIHTYDPDAISLQAVDWEPAEETCVQYGTDSEGRAVYLCQLRSRPETRMCVTTKLVI